MNIREIAIESATKYHQFATEKNKSLVEHFVRKKEINGSIISLHLFTPIASTEGLQLLIDEILYSDEFKVVDYDKEHLCLRLIADQPLEQVLQRTPEEKIRLIFDLRFLIKRIKDWYAEFGDLVTLPSKKPFINSPTTLIEKCVPSKDQESAIFGVLSSPLTYVWGAPGTGKTQVVLAESILQCLKSGKRILLTAPTNRAVEQILYGVLPVLESAGIRKDLFLRMGTPTKEFAARYPDICENTQLHLKLEEIDSLLRIHTESLTENLQQLEKYRTYENDMRDYMHFEEVASEIHSILKQLEETEKAYAIEEKNCLSFHENYAITCDRLELNCEQQNRQKRKVQILAKRLKQAESFPWRSFFASRLDQMHSDFNKETALLDELTKQENQLQIFLKDYYQNEKQAREKINFVQARLKKLFRSLRFHYATLKKYRLIDAPCPDSSVKEAKNNFERWISKGKDHFHDLYTKYGNNAEKEYAELKEQVKRLRTEIKKCEDQRNQLKVQHDHQLSQCRVIATTLDLALVRVRPNDSFKPDHVFLDEAGYAPLIKAAPLTAYQCPLTLLGDHMQLPPVCEMSEDDLRKAENAPIVLWTQSALYLEDIFLKKYDMLYQRFLANEPPFFRFMKKYDLLHSYRFGKSLASILAGTVYTKELEGDDRRNTEILFIDAPRKIRHDEKPIKRQSLAECDAIAHFIKENEDLEIGIITPYRNQKEALKKRLPDFIEINTVHGSQGREWDCVIFSVVDTTDRFFTDSNHKISNGKKIVNTAISRAKQKLIIVCDADYWKGQKQQLIGKVISIGKELKP